MDAEAVTPLLDFVQPHLAELEDRLAGAKEAPEEEGDEGMAGFWRSDLLDSQRSDVAAIVGFFGDEFRESGRARLEPEQAEPLLRGCSALRLRLRERCLEAIPDERLESGDVEIGDLSEDQRLAYLSYAFFGSLQELAIQYLDGEL